MTPLSESHLSLGVFKGIALFTPGGDLIYCIDPYKQTHWHLDLCTTLQDYLSLPEPPFFLLPCYTATVDRWQDASTQTLMTLAEAYPKVMPYQALLNTVFNLGNTTWRPVYTAGETCSPSLLETHQQHFPQLWHNHDLVIQITNSKSSTAAVQLPEPDLEGTNSHVYRLFVSSDETTSTELILELLRNTMEQVLQQPYTLQVVDVRKHPDKAEADLIAVTPTLIRTWPQPTRRIAGGLTDRDRLLSFLQREDE